MVKAIQELFNAYAGGNGQMRIGTVSFMGDMTGGVDTDGKDGITVSDACYASGNSAQSWMDHVLTTSQQENDLLFNPKTGTVSYYTTMGVNRTGGGTPTAGGLECIRTELFSSSAKETKKIVVLLSDGEPSTSLAGYGTNTCIKGDSDSIGDFCTTDTECHSSEISNDGICFTTTDAVLEAVGVRDQIRASDVVIFTAAITTNPDLVGYMTHLSSNYCSSCDQCTEGCVDSCSQTCVASFDSKTECKNVCEAEETQCLKGCDELLKECDVWGAGDTPGSCTAACKDPDSASCDDCVASIEEECQDSTKGVEECQTTCSGDLKTCIDAVESSGSCPAAVEECQQTCPTSCSSSSGSCADVCVAALGNTADCQPRDGVEYAYHASTAEELETMYQTIVNSILGTIVSYTTTFAGETTVTTGAFRQGNDMALPLPEGFDCPKSGGEWTVPIRLNFSGEGTVKISDLKLNYCPQ